MVLRKKYVLRGCTVSNSFPNGQGASAVHDRLRYEDSRDEIIAQGFADLLKLVFNKEAFERRTYVSTILTCCDNIAASSFTKCGLFAVFCN